MKREMSVAGSFYPDNAAEIERYFEHFTKVYDENFELPSINTKAVIVPHAGYIYSGFTANVAYRLLQKSGVKNFVIIGPSHRIGFEGVSMCNFETYETPFGTLPTNDFLAKELEQNFSLSCIQSAHAEHSTEVQFPFLKYYIPHAAMVELVYSSADPAVISPIIDFVLQKEDTGVIISTDLSHFYTLSQANIIDNICLNAVQSLDISQLHNGCEACGIIGVEAMMMSAKRLGLSPTLLDYRTSADVSDDKERVVGYLSAAFS